MRIHRFSSNIAAKLSDQWNKSLFWLPTVYTSESLNIRRSPRNHICHSISPWGNISDRCWLCPCQRQPGTGTNPNNCTVLISISKFFQEINHFILIHFYHVSNTVYSLGNTLQPHSSPHAQNVFLSCLHSQDW